MSDPLQGISKLLQKGALIHNPSSVYIGQEVDINRLSGKGMVIYPGCRIMGEKSLILEGAKLGGEGPVSLQNCQLGPHVELKGGSFKNSVFLENSSMGASAQVREACILEESASGAHSVGLKQTILFPFVTLGSLINFCDCLMAGGTSRKNHSEVGSSYIHFNYTPNQDKATPSLIGDVPRGVMLDQRPIFLGGQGGLIGPSRIGFGNVVAAGSILHEDLLEENRLISSFPSKERNKEFNPGLYLNIKKRVINNIIYCANLVALRHWYKDIRSQFFQSNVLGKELYKAAVEKLDLALDERMKRMKELVENLHNATKTYHKILQKETVSFTQMKEIIENWQAIEDIFYNSKDASITLPGKERFIEKIAEEKRKQGCQYLKVIQGLDKNWREMGTEWLEAIVHGIKIKVFQRIPSFQ